MENRNISSYNLSAPFLSIGKKIVVINVTPISTCISRERSPKEPIFFLSICYLILKARKSTIWISGFSFMMERGGWTWREGEVSRRTQFWSVTKDSKNFCLQRKLFYLFIDSKTYIQKFSNYIKIKMDQRARCCRQDD